MGRLFRMLVRSRIICYSALILCWWSLRGGRSGGRERDLRGEYFKICYLIIFASIIICIGGGALNIGIHKVFLMTFTRPNNRPYFYWQPFVNALAVLSFRL